MTETRHGGTDSGPAPRFDFSTNANALGPDPTILSALRAVDPAPYPDPGYRALREELAAAHGAHPEAVVLGAGASELVLRLVRVLGGPVLTLEPAFGEYRRAAEVEGRPLLRAGSRDEFLALLPRAAVGFLACPNNPDGRLLDLGFVRALEGVGPHGARLVVDLAYAPLAQGDVHVPEGAWALLSPGKAAGVTGVRAAYLVADRASGPPLSAAAPAWVLSVHGEALLRATLDPRARAWLAGTRPVLWDWRDRLAEDLAVLGRAVRPGAANFLLAEVGRASAISTALRASGIRARDASSFGLPAWLRLSAQGPVARRALLRALAPLLRERAA